MYVHPASHALHLHPLFGQFSSHFPCQNPVRPLPLHFLTFLSSFLQHVQCPFSFLFPSKPYRGIPSSQPPQTQTASVHDLFQAGCHVPSAILIATKSSMLNVFDLLTHFVVHYRLVSIIFNGSKVFVSNGIKFAIRTITSLMMFSAP